MSELAKANAFERKELSELDKKAILTKRAESLAKATADTEEKSNLLEVTTFLLGTESFAIANSAVREVIHSYAIVPVPLTPSYVMGMIALRGELVLVVNLLAYFGVDRDLTGYGNILVIANDNGDTEFGIATPKAVEVKKIDINSLSPSPESLSHTARKSILGISGGNLTVLDDNELIQARTLFVGDGNVQV